MVLFATVIPLSTCQYRLNLIVPKRSSEQDMGRNTSHVNRIRMRLIKGTAREKKPLWDPLILFLYSKIWFCLNQRQVQEKWVKATYKRSWKSVISLAQSSFWQSLSPVLQAPYTRENIHPSHFIVELPVQLKAESLSFSSVSMTQLSSFIMYHEKVPYDSSNI